MSKPTVVNCPTCKNPVTWDASSPYRPFCSQRCKLIDLGEWADENHRIEGEAVNPWEIIPGDEPSKH